MLFRVIAVLFALVFSVAAFAAQESARVNEPLTNSLVDAGATQVDASPSTSIDAAPADDYPLDDQPGQSQSEGAMDPPALMMARPDAKAPPVTMSRPRPYALAAWRAPYLDGPQRPPCAAFVSA